MDAGRGDVKARPDVMVLVSRSEVFQSNFKNNREELMGHEQGNDMITLFKYDLSSYL